MCVETYERVACRQRLLGGPTAVQRAHAGA